jgi:hypothetical protein
MTLTRDLSRIGARLGVAFGVASVGSLVGNTVSRLLINYTSGNFLRVQIFCGILVSISSVCLLLSRVGKVGWRLAVLA